MVFAAALTFFLALPISVFAADDINWTFYAPGGGGKIEGGFETSRPNLEGQSIPRTLDDVRLGKSKYVTLASATLMYGRYYCVGTVQYASPIDRQTHTLTNVVGYVHDTGCAFNGTCSCQTLPQFCDGRPRPEKMDIAVGDFRGWGALTASFFVDKNNNSAPRVWQQIAGIPQPGAAQNASACNGDPREDGVPRAAPYSPNTIIDPYTQPGGQIVPGQLYGAPIQNPGMMNQLGQPMQQPVNYQQQNPYYGNNSGSGSNTGSTQGVPGAAVSNIIVQPKTIYRGQNVVVSWTSVNMAKNTCQVFFTGQEYAKSNEGSKSFKTVSSDASSITFTLRCSDSGGKLHESSASATIQ